MLESMHSSSFRAPTQPHQMTRQVTLLAKHAQLKTGSIALHLHRMLCRGMSVEEVWQHISQHNSGGFNGASAPEGDLGRVTVRPIPPLLPTCLKQKYNKLVNQ